MDLKNRYIFQLIAVLVLSSGIFMACQKDDELIIIDADAGRSFENIASVGYYVDLEAAPVQQGQNGRWLIYKGENGRFENQNDPKSRFFGEPGENYVLGWEVSERDQYNSSEITVSFQDLNPQLKTALPDTLWGNVSVYLDALAPEFGETGSWAIIDGVNGTILDTSAVKASFVGTENTSYTVRWTLRFGSKSKSIDQTFVTTSLQANAGSDNLDIITGGKEEIRFYNLNAHLPAGATGYWTMANGDEGTVITSNDPYSLFSGKVDTEYVLKWHVAVNNYESVDTLNLRFRGKWGVWTDPRDKQTYRYVEYNGLQWMAENYNYAAPFSQYGRSWYYGQSPRAMIRDGKAIETEEDRKHYGRLYNYYGAVDATPEGWRLPSAQEYKELSSAFEGEEFIYRTLLKGGDSGLDLILAGGVGYSNESPDRRDVYFEQDINGFYMTASYFDNDFSVIGTVMYSPSKQFFEYRTSAYFTGMSVRYVRAIE